MGSVAMATSEWIQFFQEAGIPPGPAVSYAVTFVDNRIRKNMLLDLTKELMNELGITVVGDVIAILKHAKTAHRQEMCKAATESLGPGSPGVPGNEQRRNPTSAAGRMIANSLSGDAPAAAPKVSGTVGTDAGLCPAAPAEPPKRRRVTSEPEGPYGTSLPAGSSPRPRGIQPPRAAGVARTSVFERLGAEANAETTPAGKPSGVFSRLGAASDEDAGSADEGSVLPYAGVLKKPLKPLRSGSSEPGGIVKAKATSSEAKTHHRVAAAKANESEGVAGSRERRPRELRVTIPRTWGCGRVSSSSDAVGSRSVFQRLGRKPD
ncbi:uncharacterized protein C19orf47 homolog isoform X2 [Phaenicophaeus curvirostris]|uniref:uncharacterized protein C19orf47 homolog isoform X2 n=1 Tax=Phaenicophaeus curvirostris TaxID=33595 RepID=UPI0037F0D0B1